MRAEMSNEVFDVIPQFGGKQADDENIDLWTPLGKLSLYTFVSPDQLKRFRLDPQLSNNPGLGSLESRRKTLMRNAAIEDANVVLAVDLEEKIIGFCILSYPQPLLQWARMSSKAVMEVVMIEVARDWRRTGVGRALLQSALCAAWIEEKIIYLVGFTWNWDMAGAEMSASQYREMMIGLAQSFGFAEHKTNEPNVCLDVNNLFMCGVGRDVDGSLRNQFKWASFGTYC